MKMRWSSYNHHPFQTACLLWMLGLGCLDEEAMGRIGEDTGLGSPTNVDCNAGSSALYLCDHGKTS